MKKKLAPDALPSRKLARQWPAAGSLPSLPPAGAASGDGGDVHEVMLKAIDADLSFRLLLEVRNRVLQGFQELWRTPL